MNIAIIYTTFLRPSLVKQSLPSIIKNTEDDITVFVGDQGKAEDGIKDICKSLNNNKIRYIKLPFDCGLSASRNILIEEAKKLNIPYCVVTADSISFTEEYKFQPIIEFLESNEKYGTVGFDLRGRICWECDIDLIEGKCFSLDIPRRNPIIYNNIKYQPVDLHRNFFIAKTDALINNKWDNDLKLLEHEDHAWRWKQKENNYKRFYTDSIEGKYMNFKPNNYNNFRRRMYNEFMTILRKKYNIIGWVVYSDDLKKRFNLYRQGK